MGFDKRGDKLNKGKNMGLDQHAHLRGQKIDWEKYFNDDDYSENAGVFVWRKHARLQEFMAQKWTEQNPSVKVEGMLAHLGFNSDQDAPCYMTKEVVDELSEQIEKGFSDYHAEDGFFWGQQFQEESMQEYREQDKEFLKECKKALELGEPLTYECSW